MKKRVFLYIGISIICVVAIAIAVYTQIFNGKEENLENIIQNGIANTATNESSSMDTIKEELNSLFTNMIKLQKNDVSSVHKLDNTKEIVYAAYNIKQETDKYNVNINIPVVNIQGSVVEEFNKITQEIFANKATEILNNNINAYTVYSVDYVAYVNGEILSVAIKSTLKQGNDAQRTMVQTYNYNLTTGKKVTLNEMLAQKDIDTKTINTKIAQEVKKAEEQAQQLKQATGQSGEYIYSRDLNSAIYITDNVGSFLVGREGKIFIIYPYGNSNFTSEMDVIGVE